MHQYPRQQENVIFVSSYSATLKNLAYDPADL